MEILAIVVAFTAAAFTAADYFQARLVERRNVANIESEFVHLETLDTGYATLLVRNAGRQPVTITSAVAYSEQREDSIHIIMLDNGQLLDLDNIAPSTMIEPKQIEIPPGGANFVTFFLHIISRRLNERHWAGVEMQISLVTGIGDVEVELPGRFKSKLKALMNRPEPPAVGV